MANMKKILAFFLLCCILCGAAFADSEAGIADVSCGSGAVFVLMENGKLIAWGENGQGIIPGQDSRKQIKYDKRDLLMSNAKAVFIGEKCGFVINASNELYGWGEDGDAALLCGSVYGRSTKEPVKLMDNISYVAIGREHVAAITGIGELYLWGRDTNGSLGLGIGSGSIVRQPQKVMDNVKTVCCSDNNTVAVTVDGALYAWGEDFGYAEPHKFTTGITDVKKGCSDSFILQNSGGDVLLMQCIVSEDGSPAVHLTAPVASNITQLTDYGYVRDDGTLWMCQNPDSNTFIPSAKNVSCIKCFDMKHRVYVALHTLHVENFEFDRFKPEKSYSISDIDVPIEPASGGIVGALVISLVIAAAAFIVIEKPLFYQRLTEEIKYQFKK